MKKEWVLLLGIFVGILAGGLVSELFEMLAPTGMVREFFIKGVSYGIDTVTFNMGAITLTFGLTFKFTVISLFIVIVTVYYFSWWLK